jgi:predicted phage tail protein
MKTVKLYGELGKRFGRVHRFDVKTPAEAIRALSANFRDFKKFMIDSEKAGIGFRVKNGNYELENEKQVLEPAGKTIQIIPVVMGANAESRVLIGAALIAIGVVINVYAPGAGQIPIGIGASLALGGVAEMISPPPKLKEDLPQPPQNTPSSSFNGPVNTVQQGYPVPIGYGRLVVGSAVVSAGIDVTQIKQGFKRVKNNQTIAVRIIRATGVQWLGDGVDNTVIPANWFARIIITPNVSTSYTPPLGQSGIVDKYNYEYFVWDVVPV